MPSVCLPTLADFMDEVRQRSVTGRSDPGIGRFLHRYKIWIDDLGSLRTAGVGIKQKDDDEVIAPRNSNCS